MKPAPSSPAVPRSITVRGVTVKLYAATLRGAPAWQVADRSTGRRVLRTFTDKARALAEAKRVASAIAEGDAEKARFTGRERAQFVRASALLEPAAVPLEVAASRYAEAVKVLGADLVLEAARFYARHHRLNVPAVTLGDAAREFIADAVRRKMSERYVDDLRVRLRRLCADLGEGAVVRDLDTPAMQAWLDGLALSPQSRGNFRRVTHSLFAFGRRRGWCVANPVADVSRERIRPKDREPLTPDELRRLLAAAAPEFVPVLVIGSLCGLRTSEIERLQWSDVDLPRRILTVRAESKTGRRIVPLHDPVPAWLAPYAGRSGPVWAGTPEALHDAQGETAKAAGLTWKSNWMRVSAASYLTALHGAVQTAEWLGNSPAVIRKTYRELVTPEQARAWYALAPEAPANVTALPLAA